jgi:PAS domain S-box-containing protein
MNSQHRILRIFEAVLRDIEHPARSAAQVLHEMLKHAVQFIGADRGDLAIWSEHKRELIVGAVFGETPHAIDQKGRPVPEQSVIMSLWKNERQTCRIIENVALEKPNDYCECNQRTVGEIAVRLKFSSRSLGILNFEFFSPRKYRSYRRTARLLANWISLALQVLIYPMGLKGKLDEPCASAGKDEPFFKRLLESLKAAYGFDAGLIYLVDESQKRLRCVAYMDTPEHAVDFHDITFAVDGHSIASKVVRDGEAYWAENFQRDAQADKTNPIAATIRGPVVAVPLASEQRIIGALVVWARHGIPPEPRHKELLTPFALLASSHIVRSKETWHDQNFAVLRALTGLSDAAGLDLTADCYRQVIFEGMRSRGLERGRIFVLKPAERKLMCVATYDGDAEDLYRGRSSSLDQNPYARHLARNCTLDPTARKYDPLNPVFFGPDPTAARFGKPPELSWVAAPIVVDGELYGQITGDNKFSRTQITQETLDYLTLLTNVVSRTLTVAKRRDEAEKLHQSEALYHTLVDNLKQGVFCKNKSGVFTFVNRYFCRHLGETPRTPRDVEGKTDFDFFPPALAHRYRNDDEAILNGRKKVVDVEEPHPGRNGRIRYVRVIKIPIRDSHNRIVGVQGIFWDVTERRRLAMEMSCLMNASPDSIYFKGKNSQFLRINPAMKKLMRIKRIDGKDEVSDFDIFQEKNAHEKFDVEQRIIRTGKAIKNLVEEELFLDGRHRWVLTTKVPLRDYLGEIIGTCGVSQEITALKNAQDELREANEQLRIAKQTLETRVLERTEALQRLTDLLALSAIGLSNPHDFINPLATVQGQADVLLSLLAKNDVEGAKEIAALIKEAAGKGAKGVRAVLFAARHNRIEKVSVDLVSSVSEWLKSLQDQLRKKSTKIDLSSKKEAFVVPVEATLLRLAFRNVCLNSIDAIGEGQTINVLLETRGVNEIVIEIADHGPGFPESILTSNLLPVSGMSGTSHQGLGLIITRRILDLHSGKVEFAQTAGGGATTRLVLPAK